MKDARDRQTIDAFPMPKKRGRPSTGSAKSAAERKRLQRKRAAEMRIAMRKSDVVAAPVTSLIEEMAIAVRTGNVVLAQKISAELLRRAKQNSGEHQESQPIQSQHCLFL